MQKLRPRPAFGHHRRIEQTRAGLAAAAANGRKGGRPRKVDDAHAAKALTMRDKGVAATDIAKMLGVSRATVYRYLPDRGRALRDSWSPAPATDHPAHRDDTEHSQAAPPTDEADARRAMLDGD